MSQFKTVDLEQGSEAWLAYRKNGIGASEYPAIMGVVGSYQSREDIIEAKLGTNPKKLSDFTKRLFEQGHEIEASVREEFNKTGFYDLKPVVVESLDNPRIFASLDGYCSSTKTLIEVKSTTKQEILEMVEAKKVPPIYYHQMQYQMFVTGLSASALIVVNSTTKERHIIRVEADTSQFPEIKRNAEAFLYELDSRKNILTKIDSDADALRLEQVTASIKALEDQVKILEDEKKFLADALLRKYNAFVLSSPRMTVEYCERQGSVDYKSIPELAGVDLDKYRKKPSSYIKVTLAKGN